jgi:hypothetical protein
METRSTTKRKDNEMDKNKTDLQPYPMTVADLKNNLLSSP